MESLGEDFVEKRAGTENEFCYQSHFGNKKSIYLFYTILGENIK